MKSAMTEGEKAMMNLYSKTKSTGGLMSRGGNVRGKRNFISDIEGDTIEGCNFLGTGCAGYLSSTDCP